MMAVQTTWKVRPADQTSISRGSPGRGTTGSAASASERSSSTRSHGPPAGLTPFPAVETDRDERSACDGIASPDHPGVSMFPPGPKRLNGTRRGGRLPHGLFVDGVDVSTGSCATCQMCSQYSRIARSEEKRPHRATLTMDIRDHRSWSWYAVPTLPWQST